MVVVDNENIDVVADVAPNVNPVDAVVVVGAGVENPPNILGVAEVAVAPVGADVDGALPPNEKFGVLGLLNDKDWAVVAPGVIPVFKNVLVIPNDKLKGFDSEN